MIEWESPTWGGGVTYAANGSWVKDKHDRTIKNVVDVVVPGHPQDAAPSPSPSGSSRWS
ncbi:MAG: hypothetical protein JWP74_2003 [Marmoricola sp.]|nr:hypothetical protein [Marmoricola sp.]